MVAMYSNIAQDNWAELLPCVQLAYNTAFHETTHETPFFLMFGRQARLPIDVIFGISHVGWTADTEDYSHSIRKNLQIVFELARRNLRERADKQTLANKKLPPFPDFKPQIPNALEKTVSNLFEAIPSYIQGEVTE